MVVDRLLEVGSWQHGQRIIATAAPKEVKTKNAFRPKKPFACERMAQKSTKDNPLDLTKIVSKFLAESLPTAPERETSLLSDATPAIANNKKMTSLLVEYREADNAVVGMLQRSNEKVELWTHPWEHVERCLLAEPISLPPGSSLRSALKACKKDLQNIPSNVLEQLIRMKKKVVLNRNSLRRPPHKDRGRKISAVDTPRPPAALGPLPLEQRSILPVPVKSLSSSEHVGPTLSQLSLGKTLSQMSSTSVVRDSKVMPSVSSSSLASATSQKQRARLSPGSTETQSKHPFGMKLQTPRTQLQSGGGKNGDTTLPGKDESRSHRHRHKTAETVALDAHADDELVLVERAAKQLKRRGPKKDEKGAHTSATETPAANNRELNAQERRRPPFKLMGGPFGPSNGERVTKSMTAHPPTLSSSAIADEHQGGLTWQRSTSDIAHVDAYLAGPTDRSLLSTGAFEPWPGTSPNASAIPLEKVPSPTSSLPKSPPRPPKSSPRSRPDESAGSAGLSRNIILFETSGAQQSFEALPESDEDSYLDELEDDEEFYSSSARNSPLVVRSPLVDAAPHTSAEMAAPERMAWSPTSQELMARNQSARGTRQRLSGNVLSPTEMFLPYPIPTEPCTALGSQTHRPMDDAVAVSRGLRGKNLARWGTRGSHQPRKPHLPPPPRQFGIAGLSVAGPYHTLHQHIDHATNRGQSAESAQLGPASGSPYSEEFKPQRPPQPRPTQDNIPIRTKLPQITTHSPASQDWAPAAHVRYSRASDLDPGPHNGVLRIHLQPRSAVSPRLQNQLSGSISPRHRHQLSDLLGGQISPRSGSAQWPPPLSSTVETEEALIVSTLSPLTARPPSNRAPARPQGSTPATSPRPSVCRGRVGLDEAATGVSRQMSLSGGGGSYSRKLSQIAPVVDSGRGRGTRPDASEHAGGQVGQEAAAYDMLADGDVSGWGRTESSRGRPVAGPLSSAGHRA